MKCKARNDHGAGGAGSAGRTGGDARRGFTLIELLVVIAIIAVLISLQAPNLAGIRERGRRLACASNLRQIYIAHMAYAAANRGEVCPAVPGRGSAGAWHGPGTIWVRHLPRDLPLWSGTGRLWNEGFLDDMRVSYCPSSINPKLHYSNPETGFNDGDGGTARWIQQHYHQRATVGLTTGQGANQPKLHIDPPGMAFMADHWPRSGFYAFPGHPYPVDWTHRTGYNVLYLDGSTEFLHDPDRRIVTYMANVGLTDPKRQWPLVERVWLNMFDR